VDRTGASRGALSLALIAGLAACSAPGSREPAPGLGVRRAGGVARALFPSRDGAWLAFLDGCREARAVSLPAGTASCDLRVVPAAGGEARVVAGGVTTLSDGVIFSSAATELAALARYDYAGAAGTLVLWRPESGARELGGGVTFHGFGPGGELGYIAGGELFVLPPGGEPAEVPGTTGASSFELGSARGRGDAGALAALVRRRSAAGGELLAVAAGARAMPVAAPVGDYGFDRGGARYAFTTLGRRGAELLLAEARPGARPSSIGRDVRAFTFAPAGDAIAFVADVKPGEQGDLHVLRLSPQAGEPGAVDALLGKEVGEYRWATRAPRLVWLERYDPRVRAGTVGAGGLDLPRRTFAANVSDVEISADGRNVAFLQHTTRGGYSVDLFVAALDAPAGAAPKPLARGVFGFAFSPDGRWLYYRTRCTRNAEACDLERVPAEGPAPGAKPELVVEGAKSFEFDPRDPGRLLVTWQRMDRNALDVAVWEVGKLTSIDTYVLPGSARFLGPDSRRVAYVVMHEKRQGVYVAELPR